MTAPSTRPEAFEPPGPGSWTLDTTHFSRPATRFVVELFPEPVARGFRESTARYGLLLDRIDWEFVHGWAYLCPRPVWSLDTDGERPTRAGWDQLAGSSPTLADRLATSASVFEKRLWRGDVEHWDRVVKPASAEGHRALWRVDVDRLEPAALADHLLRCRENVRNGVYLHHRYNVTPVIAVGDFLVHAREWTDRPAAELLGLLQGSSPLSLGAAAELERLARAVAADPAARTLVSSAPSSGDAASAVTSLVAWPGEVGPAAAAYVDLVGCWPVGTGFDVGEPGLAEVPAALLGTIAAAVRPLAPPAGADGEEAAAARAEIRAAVPSAQRASFDELLVEARSSHRVRDERAIFCDIWAYGLARRAILAAGRRLADAGRLHEPAHLAEAGWDEMRSLVAVGAGPSADALAGRARHRQDARLADAPPFLGPSPRPPIPADWLPPGAARTERAFRTYLGAMAAADEDEDSGGGDAVRGEGASAGTYEGTARLVLDAGDFARLRAGDVLVAPFTSPAFNVVLTIVGAVVTDSGGPLSHAAIVAREYGIPAVVGSGDATRRIPDGARVRVDGGTGEVTLLTRG